MCSSDLEIEAEGGVAHVVTLDVTDPQSIAAAVAHAETEMGAIDILINNSGVSTTQRLAEVTAEDFDYVMDTNCRGAFFVAQAVAKRMMARSRGAGAEAQGPRRVGSAVAAHLPDDQEGGRLDRARRRRPGNAERRQSRDPSGLLGAGRWARQGRGLQW